MAPWEEEVVASITSGNISNNGRELGDRWEYDPSRGSYVRHYRQEISGEALQRQRAQIMGQSHIQRMAEAQRDRNRERGKAKDPWDEEHTDYLGAEGAERTILQILRAGIERWLKDAITV
jgi:hypothetical protein